MDSVISLQRVSKRFGRCVALDEVTLQVPSGVVFALLGENGAGKTTLIRILTGFLAPDRGEVRVLRRSPFHDAFALRREIGYVSDAPALYDWMTASEIGWFTSGFYADGFLRRFSELMVKYQVPTDTKLKHLSKGQRAKVALALATSHDPALLILDEPTSGLDPMVRRQFLESMVDRAALGQTVLLSSHQISEVERVADWVAILHQGVLKVVEPLEELKRNVTILTGRLEDTIGEVPLPRGEVLTEIRRGRQIRWVVKGFPEDGGADYGADSGVRELTVSHPTLEEVFVAICDDNGRQEVAYPTCIRSMRRRRTRRRRELGGRRSDVPRLI